MIRLKSLLEVSKERMAELRAAVEDGRMTRKEFLAALQSPRQSTKQEALKEAKVPLADYADDLQALTNQLEDLEDKIRPGDRSILVQVTKHMQIAHQYLSALAEKY